MNAGPAWATYQDGTLAYESGNIAKAVAEWKQAAETGDPRAQFRLGQIYEQGRDAIQNLVEAHRWYNIAACQGNEEAMQGRDRIAKQLTVEELGKARQLASTWGPVSSQSVASRS